MTSKNPIARRTYTIGPDGPRTLEVIVHAPVADGNDYRCDYDFVENGRLTRTFHGMGVDSMQALVSALQRLGSDLIASDQAIKRDLYWNGQNERLGLLLPPNDHD